MTTDAPRTAQDGPLSHGTPELAPEYPPDTLKGMARFLRFWPGWATHPAADELTALLTHRDTYALTLAPRFTLRRRDRWQIQGHPADTVLVVAAHACGHPLGTPLPAPSNRSTDVVVPF